MADPVFSLDGMDPRDELSKILQSRSNDLEEIRRIIEKRVDPNFIVTGDGHRSPLILAAEAGNIELVTLLCSLGAKPDFMNSNLQTAVMFAAVSKRITTVEYLTSVEGFNVNHADGFGNTILMYVACYPETPTEIVECLFKFGPDLSMKNKDGKTCVDHANEKKFDFFVEIARDYEEGNCGLGPKCAAFVGKTSE